MSRRSRGCLKCRQRRVKCDLGRPSCMRCVARSEICVGYREEADLIFQDETEKTVRRQVADLITVSPSSTASTRSRSLSPSRLGSSSSPSFTGTFGTPNSTVSWSRVSFEPDANLSIDGEDPAVSKLFENYVLYPCSDLSTPGFLEHLPCLFKEVNVPGRYALRWAVQAFAYADLSRRENSQSAVSKALDHYGRSLSALGKSLSEEGKVPDDYDLMTVVILDIFETLFFPESSTNGSHAQGMAHILRLRGHEQFHNPRGWGLFRLAHHLTQKRQLVNKLNIAPVEDMLLMSYAGNDSFGGIQKDGLKISNICKEAENILHQVLQLDATESSQGVISDLAQRMMDLDEEAVSWRQSSEWGFQALDRRTILGDEGLAALLPDTIEMHPDLWMVYEWNYHRTARVILHQQLVSCINKMIDANILDGPNLSKLQVQKTTSISIVQQLVDQVLSTVPQSFGDIDQHGRISMSTTSSGFQAIGAYFLLWPMKIFKSDSGAASVSQRAAATAVFERIRECTGMKQNLGSLSMI